ncbi:MAG: ATP-binding protein [Lachnospiraceae bacterium]|nr:ATP-binding protein [Lachnospiraceae bacterium]
MKSLIVKAVEDNLEQVTAFVDEELEAYGCGSKVQMQIDIAIEEIFANIVNYAYHPVEGEAEVRCEVMDDPLRVIIQFLDNGKPFNPLDREEADISIKALEQREGGLGIFMVKKSMDGVRYSYENGKNILTIEKNF